MALSPNYGWSEPDNSSLVKNGAADIRTLGNAIDTSVWNVGFGQAGKNKIINGDFSVNQRNFSSSTTSAEYNFDRWRTIYTGGTSTTSAQVFTAGTAPVAGYEGKNYYRVVVTGQSAVTDFCRIQQVVEGVRPFAGQTTTYSFWAKASTGTPKVAIQGVQYFGSTGSPSASVTTSYGTVTLSTSWARYSVTCAIPSISGKTLGTSNDDQTSIRLLLSAGTSVTDNQSIGVQNYTFETWGHQWEYGSTATPFQTASGGSPQAELAMCQRYYWRAGGDSLYQSFGSGATNFSGTTSVYNVNNPVAMRVAPTSVDFSTLANSDYSAFAAISALTISYGGKVSSMVSGTTAGTTSFRPSLIVTNNSTSGYIGFSAEL